MAHILALELKPRIFAGGIAEHAPALESENVATVWVDWDNYKWKVRTREQQFEAIFHEKNGVVNTNQGFLLGDADQSLGDARGEEVVVLRNYGLNPRAKLHGIAMFGANPQATGTMMGGVANAYNFYTYFWRKLSGKDMTRTERGEEMFCIAVDKYGPLMGSVALDQMKGLATADSLFQMGAFLLVFATGEALVAVRGLMAAIKVVCGFVDVGTNWEIYGPYWQRFQTQLDSGSDLDDGAEGLATVIGGLLGYTGAGALAGKITSRVAPHVQKHANRLADAIRGSSPQRWKQAAQQGVAELKQEAAAAGDPSKTKIDPAKDLTPEERRAIEAQKAELLARVREEALKLGYPPHIAEGYAMLALRNGWTIIARTSKKSSIPHHLLGPERVTGKSLYVEYKIDARYGVVLEEGGRNVERDFYGTHTYAAKQMEAIYYAEHADAPKGSFQVTEALIQEFRRQHVFEFREVTIEGKKLRVLFHNGRMVIGDVDLMGIYVKRGNDLVPLPQWMIHNDAAFLQDFINRNVGGVETSFHGQQDVGRNAKGNPFRQPDATEDFGVFSPDLTLRRVKGTAALERLYRNLHILWPYQTYIEVRDALTAFAVAAGRRKDEPKPPKH